MDPSDFLEKLRADLRHFEESGHLGEDATIMETKERLLARIEELESALRHTAELEAAVLPDKEQ
jgi:hypothetical protein